MTALAAEVVSKLAQNLLAAQGKLEEGVIVSL
jgi:hypothetical protein